jgi:signal transduction histidine kinase/tetratricopeptide (TPR) repeat protein
MLGNPNQVLEFACTSEALDKLEAALAGAPQVPGHQRLAALLPLAWHLRQRDTTRALLLADEAEASLAASGLVAGERLGMAARLSLIRGEAKWLFSESDEGAALAAHALRDFTACDDPIGCADAHWLLAYNAHGQGDPARRDMSTMTIITSVEAIDPVRVTIAKTSLAISAAYRDAAAAKRDWWPQFATGIDAMHPAAAAWVEFFWGITAGLSGEYVDAIRHYGNCHTLALATGQIRLAIVTATHIGNDFNNLNDHHAALEWMQRGLELARPRAWFNSLGLALMQTAETLRLLQRFGAARELLREAMALMSKQAASQSYAIALGYLGDVELNLRHYDDALASFQLLEQRGHALDRDYLLCRALRGQAKAQLELNLPQAALASAHAALNAAKSEPKDKLDALRVLADIHARHSLPPPPGMSAASAALHYLQQAYDFVTTITGFTIPGDLLEALADEYAKVGDFAQAWQRSKQAIAAHAKIHSREAANRASAMQVNHETQRVWAEGEHHRKLAAAHAERADALEQANSILAKLGAVGCDITANLDADIVFQSLYLYVGSLLNASTMTIHRMNAAGTLLEAVFGREDDQIMPMRNIPLDSPTSNVAKVVRERQELLLHFDTVHESTHIPGTRQMYTALFSPLIVDEKVLGVMSIQSDKADAWGERERLIFRTLSAYGAIAMANSAAIEALRQAQGQLVQQEKMASLGGLVAGIAHEINTPLGNTLVAISGVECAWQTLQNAVVGDRISKTILESTTTKGMECTALALKTASRAAELIALFKTISVNADSDRSMDIELADYLEEVATMVRIQLVQNGCKLEVSAPAGLKMKVVVDALTETLSRILVNTLDHGFAGGRTGTLRLAAQIDEADDGDEVIITVSDDGHGIAPEDLPKVFDPFFTTKSGIDGHVGLGLHVAYNQVTQRLKGKIHITSTLGEGTCVEIRLKKHG